MSTVVVRSSGNNDLQLEVVKAGGTVTVKAGTFVIAKTSHSLGADSDFTVTSRPNVTYVFGYLVKEIASGVVSVLVDEFIDDGVDSAYSFGGSPYELLSQIFRFVLPPNTATLNSVDVTVLTVQPRVVETVEPS